MEQDLNEEIINQISDLFAAFQWLQKLNIDSKGVSDLEGAKCKLLQYIQQSRPVSSSRTSNVSWFDRSYSLEDPSTGQEACTPTYFESLKLNVRSIHPLAGRLQYPLISSVLELQINFGASKTSGGF